MMMGRNLDGWERMWQALAAKGYDIDAHCPVTGEGWQYMGSGHGVHTFRHRCLNGERVYEDVPLLAEDFLPLVYVPERVDEEEIQS